jgi:hypothetical protein
MWPRRASKECNSKPRIRRLPATQLLACKTFFLCCHTFAESISHFISCICAHVLHRLPFRSDLACVHTSLFAPRTRHNQGLKKGKGKKKGAENATMRETTSGQLRCKRSPLRFAPLILFLLLCRSGMAMITSAPAPRAVEQAQSPAPAPLRIAVLTVATGNYAHKYALAVVSKECYARMHSYSFHLDVVPYHERHRRVPLRR